MGVRKQKWTAEEEAALDAGIAKYGLSKWSKIIKDPEFGAVLHMRSGTDLKDKWRNMQLPASGLRSRRRSRPAVNNNQATPVFNDISIAPNTVVTDDVEVGHATPLPVVSETLPNSGSKKPLSRLEDHILEAITALKEPHGSSRRSIAMYVEEHYLPHPKLEKLLKANLMVLTDNGKLIKVKNQYRIAPASILLDPEEGTSLLLQEGEKDCPRAETNATKVLTSSTQHPQNAGREYDTTASLLIGQNEGDQRRHGQKDARTRADIIVRLRNKLSMTQNQVALYGIEEAVAVMTREGVAAQGIKEAEAVVAEAEEDDNEALTVDRYDDAVVQLPVAVEERLSRIVRLGIATRFDIIECLISLKELSESTAISVLDQFMLSGADKINKGAYLTRLISKHQLDKLGFSRARDLSTKDSELSSFSNRVQLPAFDSISSHADLTTARSDGFPSRYSYMYSDSPLSSRPPYGRLQEANPSSLHLTPAVSTHYGQVGTDNHFKTPSDRATRPQMRFDPFTGEPYKFDPFTGEPIRPESLQRHFRSPY